MEGAADEYSLPGPDDDQNWNSELQRKMELSVLKEIDNIEERVCSASLQVNSPTRSTFKVNSIFYAITSLISKTPFFLSWQYNY